MNYGKFFRLNNEKSDLGKGITVFDYIWLRDNKCGNGFTEFPIYVTLCKDSIDFHAHYHEDYTENNKHIHKHLHNTILSLPLSANLDIKDGLTGALVEAYKTQFPKYDKGESNYLFKMLLRTILKHKEVQIDYSSLSIFGENNKNIFQLFFEKLELDYNACNVVNSIEASNSDKLFNCFIRKLILDFIFDLEHTHVFQNSPYYEHISIKLRENFFFNALANKAMYYYYRDIAKDDMEEDAQRKLFFLKEYFLPAEEQWVNSITSPQSDRYFTLVEKGWFDNPEKEMLEIYKNGVINGINLYGDVDHKKEGTKDIEKKLKRITKNVSKWQLKKFDFWNVFPLSVFFFSILLLVITFYFTQIKLSSTIPCEPFIIIGLQIVEVIILSIFLNFLYNPKLCYSKGIHLFLPRLFAAILATWITLSFSEDLIKTFYKFPINWAIIIGLLSLTGIFVWSEISKTVTYISHYKKLKRTGFLLSIAFFYSYIIGLITTSFVSGKFLTNMVCCHHSKNAIVEIGEMEVFPNFLFQFTFVAMFIGIFINLIFEDKRITDSV